MNTLAFISISLPNVAIYSIKDGQLWTCRLWLTWCNWWGQWFYFSNVGPTVSSEHVSLTTLYTELPLSHDPFIALLFKNLYILTIYNYPVSLIAQVPGDLCLAHCSIHSTWSRLRHMMGLGICWVTRKFLTDSLESHKQFCSLLSTFNFLSFHRGNRLLPLFSLHFQKSNNETGFILITHKATILQSSLFFAKYFLQHKHDT